MQMGLFTLWPEDCDQFHRPVDGPEPVRGSRVELEGFAGIDDEILIAEK